MGKIGQKLALIIGVAIVLCIIVFIYVTPSLRYKMETGFISSEEAINIDSRHSSGSYMKDIGTTFVLLKYKYQEKERFVVTMYNSDPYSKEDQDTGQVTILSCFPCQWNNQADRFAWVIPISISTCDSKHFVDAKTGEFIGVWYSGSCSPNFEYNSPSNTNRNLTH